MGSGTDASYSSKHMSNGKLLTASDDDTSLTAGDGRAIGNGIGPPRAKQFRRDELTPSSHQCMESSTDAVVAGPDELAPADSIYVWNREDAVRIDLTDDGKGQGPWCNKPKTVVTALRETVARIPDHVALADKVNGEWRTLTYQQYYEYVTQAAKSFIKLGLERYHGVGILGFNSSEWFISHLAAIFAGGLSTGIYATNSAEICQSIAHAAECNVIVVENSHQLKKILKVWDCLPLLRAVVQYKGEVAANGTRNVYSWEEFLRMGSDVADSVLDERINAQAPNKCCSLIYTSGTTGAPKGVMLSHDNLVWTANMCAWSFRWRHDCEVMVSYLPLSHVAAQIVDIIIPIVYGASIYFAQPDALKGTLGDTLKEVRPTAVFGVPRVWEKIQEKMIAAGKLRSTLSKWLVSWAKRVGFAGTLSQLNGGSVPYGWTVANYLVFQSIRSALGFDRCVYFVSSAAPISKETLDFFLSLNIPIMEVYGMSECSGPHTFTLPWQYQQGSVGKPFMGASIRLHDVDKDGNGEICMRGRHVFMGYLNDERQTRLAMDDDGWLHSGDVGRIDENGYLYITGRLKELLITAGGENVPPVPIEEAVKEQLPCVSNCMVVGDRRKFLSILLTLKTIPDPETQEPTDMLDATAIEWFRSQGVEVSTVDDVRSRANDPEVDRLIRDGITRANGRAVSRAQNLQKYIILPRDFSIHGGELGPTLKLKRQVVSKFYEKDINELYAETDAC